ncbi:MAG: DUF167 domain-containing protein [Planctomycetota bacterium]
MSAAVRVEPCEGGARFRVAARPGAGRSAVQGAHDGALKVAVGAPPEKGKANKELVAFLAKQLGLRKAQLELIAGETSRDKTLRVSGLEPAELQTRLAGLLP